MIKYNWKILKRLAGAKPARVIAILYLLTEGVVSKQQHKHLIGLNLTEIQGESFLINPRDLLYYRNEYSLTEVIMYVHLASLRNHALYHLEGKTTLPLLHADIHEKYIQQNGLLEIVGNDIHFKYEE